MQKRKVSSTFKREKISLEIQERIYPLSWRMLLSAPLPLLWV